MRVVHDLIHECRFVVKYRRRGGVGGVESATTICMNVSGVKSSELVNVSVCVLLGPLFFIFLLLLFFFSLLFSSQVTGRFRLRWSIG